MLQIPALKTQVATSIPADMINKKKILKKRIIKIVSIVSITLTVLGIFFFIFAYLPGQQLFAQVMNLKTDAAKLQTAVANKDLKDAQVQIDNLKVKVKNLQTTFNKLSYLQIVPFAKDYYVDGQRAILISNYSLETGEIVIKAVEPYQDFLSLKGATVDGNKTAQDRITFLTQSVEGIVPHLDTIEQKIGQIETNLDQIDPNRYPETYNDTEIRANIFKAKEMVFQAHQLIKNGKPIISKTSWLLGKDKPRNYLMIFQNDAELRPTGGFWTAYGTLKVDNGKLTPGISDDIYSLDAKYTTATPVPRPLKAYHLNITNWNIRDLNISPDFPTSVELFLERYNKITRGKEKIDAVIGLDTTVLVNLVRVLGGVGVPGWGNFSAEPDKRCDGCPQIIYQLETIADQPRSFIVSDRKGFLGPLMNSLLSNAMGSGKDKIGPLAEVALNDIFQKHVLFYFTDPDTQKAAVLANIAGSITPTDKNTDYFHLNDANMASAKTNLFIKQKIKHEITTKDGQVEHKISITYTNPTKASNCNLEKGDLCLNAPKYRDWFRFYVPTGSKLIKMTGSEVDPVVYEELNKQVFEGFYGNNYPLYALASTKTSIQYTSSVPASKDYSLLLQKQPGTKGIDYELIVNDQTKETFIWNSDKTIKLPL